MEQQLPFAVRKSTRIPRYDYSAENYYFVTICTKNMQCIFGSIFRPNALARIAQEEMLRIPEHYQNVTVEKFVVMPNHVHAIIIISGTGIHEKGPTLNSVVGSYKSGVTRRIHQMVPGIIVWQRSFHDHVIRNQHSYERIWTYIENNPISWEQDCFHCEAP